MNLYEILVPTMMIRATKLVPIKTRYHRVWDSKVREISGGLSILQPIKGQWISLNNELFTERMIPVRILCTEEQIKLIADMTAKYYNQEAILYYLISAKAVIKHYPKTEI